MTADRIYNIIRHWADETFGKNRNNRMILRHLEEELNELAIATDNADKGFDDKLAMLHELADVQILLWNFAANNDVCFNTLMDMVIVKHQRNTKRKWVLIDGKMKHLPDDMEVIE